MFGSLGVGEIILIVLVLLILFGAKKIPDIAQGLGKGMKEFRNALKNIGDDINNPDKDKDEEKKVK
jgi:sec-independent protein translocase protein TatA